MILEAMRRYFSEADDIDIRNVEVNLSTEKPQVLYEGRLLKQYDCVYAKGSFRYETLLRSITASLIDASCMPLKPETFTEAHNKLLTHIAIQM